MAISLYELSQRISSSMPLGTIVPYYGTDEPSGWKICDGRSCTGSELAKKLGISNVPDLRGRFIRMIGGNAAGMAAAQGDELKGHTHLVVNNTSTTGGLNGSNYLAYQRHDASYDSYNLSGSSIAPSKGLTSLYGGVETRPVNMAFNYIIKVGTNVILYYVSNIIYKAIAVGKSLLSRTKEEVRRAMAISLNNHEGRISKIESSYTLAVWKDVKTLYYIDESNVADNDVIDFNGKDMIFKLDVNWKEYSFIAITFVFGVGKKSSISHKPYVTRVIPTGLARLKWLYDGDFYQADRYDGVKYCLFENHLEIQGWGNHTPEGYVKEVVGIKQKLKQYYCFSNNILLYRLTQRLFDSSLLGLFSQKGGARTI